MDEDPSVIEVFLDGELILPCSSAPEYDQLLHQVSDLLNLPVTAFSLHSQDTHQLVNSAETFNQAFADAELPLILTVQLQKMENFYCPFCDREIKTENCGVCQTVNWDAWFIMKFGEEKYRNSQEQKIKEFGKGFSFGPAAVLQPNRPVFEPAKEIAHKGQFDDDDELNQRQSEGDFQRDSFGEPRDIFHTPPRKPKPEVGFTTTDGMVHIETPPQQKQKESPPVATISDSPDIMKTTGRSTGLQPSPYLTPDKTTVHNRATCSICQRSQRTASILTRQSEYRDSLFRYSKASEDTSYYHRSSPLRSSKLLTESSLFTSNRPVRQSYNYRTSGAETLYEEKMYSESMSRLRGSEGWAERSWKCYRCGSRPPWYFTHCHRCELAHSLALQPDDDYKRRVEHMCRRS